MQSTRNNRFVVYHAQCEDGFGAAYAAWKVLGSRAEYLPYFHGDPVPDFPADAQVTFVDIALPRDQLLDLAARVRKVEVLDHHKTAEHDLG